MMAADPGWGRSEPLIDRRRSARLVALLAAALAVAGTSAPLPPTAPPQHLTRSGTIHFDAGQRVAVQLISVAVDAGALGQLAFGFGIDEPGDSGPYAVAIASAAGDASSIGTSSTPGPGTRTARFSSSCTGQPCSHTFALVVLPIDAPPKTAVDVTWHLDTTAEFAPAYGAGSPPPGRVVVTALEPTRPAEIKVASATSGSLVHLTEADRFRGWTVDIHRDAPDGPAGDPATVVVLRTTATQTTGPAFGSGGRKDRRETDRGEPPVQGRLQLGNGSMLAGWAGAGPQVVQEVRCAERRAACDDALTVELAWADGRPETEFDASWSLDVISVSSGGESPNVTADAHALARAGSLVNGTAEGSFDARGPALNGQATIRAVLTPNPIVSGLLGPIFFPSRGLLTATVTSTGTTPLPADAEVLVSFAPRERAGLTRPEAGQIGLGDGGHGSVAFEPTIVCTDRSGATVCALDGSVSARLVSGSPNQASDGLAVRVDWTLELGVGIGRAGSFDISVGSAAGASVRP